MEDELVCQRCGIVREKQVLEIGPSSRLVAIDFTGQALGGYMGTVEGTRKERGSRGLAQQGSSYQYLKLVSDYAGREESAVYATAKMIERVSEKLSLPTVVMAHAIVIAKKVLASERGDRRITLATVSAYALVAACKAEGVTAVSIKDVVGSFQALGRRVKVSSLIQLSLDSPIKTEARGPEDYVGRVIVKLGSDGRLTAELKKEGVQAVSYFNSLRTTAVEILGSLAWSAKVGRSPCALAATAVYGAELLLADREGRRRRLTQRQVAECGDTAEYTVREQYKEIFTQAHLRSPLEARALLPAPRQR